MAGETEIMVGNYQSLAVIYSTELKLFWLLTRKKVVMRQKTF